jgi:tetratricopeptide (TPR) repeat protein
MAIAVSCPHCGKSYTLKDHLQGKRVACTNPTCKKVFLVQLRTGNNGAIASARVEDLALAALVEADKPAKEEVEAGTQKIRVVCQYCDFANDFEASMAGKNAPCQNEECRKIIKIPLPKKEDPRDWRTVQRRPSAAKVDQAGFEGAWGNVETTAVSREAILEAKANVLEEREPRSWGQIAGIIMAASAIVVLVVVGVIWTWKRRTQGRQEQAIEMALNLAKGEEKRPTSLKRPQQGLIRLLAGRHELAKGNATAAKVLFNEARRDLDQGPSNAGENLAALIELACWQCELAAPPQTTETIGKLDWERDKISGEIRATLSRLPQTVGPPYSDMRAYAVRQFVPILVASGHHQAAVAMANSMASQNEQAEVLSLLGLKLLEKGHHDEARRIAGQAANLPKANASSLIALWLALDPQEGAMKAREIAPPPGSGPTTSSVAQIGYAEGLARQGNFVEARKIAYTGLPEDQLRAGFCLIGVQAIRSEIQSEDVDRCAKLVETELKGRGDLDWLIYSFVDTCLRGGKPDSAKRFAMSISESTLKAWARYRCLRYQEETVGTVTEEAVADVGPPDTLGHWMAWCVYARAKARQAGVGETMSEVRKWASDVQRAFGLAGIALAQN